VERRRPLRKGKPWSSARAIPPGQVRKRASSPQPSPQKEERENHSPVARVRQLRVRSNEDGRTPITSPPAVNRLQKAAFCFHFSHRLWLPV
jgi:hypothetical protein